MMALLNYNYKALINYTYDKQQKIDPEIQTDKLQSHVCRCLPLSLNSSAESPKLPLSFGGHSLDGLNSVPAAWRLNGQKRPSFPGVCVGVWWFVIFFCLFLVFPLEKNVPAFGWFFKSSCLFVFLLWKSKVPRTSMKISDTMATPMKHLKKRSTTNNNHGSQAVSDTN